MASEGSRLLLGSLVPEERRGRLGDAHAAALARAAADPGGCADEFVVAACASLAAGEPRRALRELAELGESADKTLMRRVAACRAWAEQLDGNWYPGDSGAERKSDGEGMSHVSVVRSGDAETMLLEACAACGLVPLYSVRSLLESMVRKAVDATPWLESGLNGLEHFKEIALEVNAPTAACWAMQAQADLWHRAGHEREAQTQLERARAIWAESKDGIGLACAYLVEGDWSATPGSSPEALGFDLDGRPEASPYSGARDLARAAQVYDQAEAVIPDGYEGLRVTAALALRRSVLGFLSGKLDEQRRHLALAERAFACAGETAAQHLVLVHQLIAAVASGDDAALRGKIPPEWGMSPGPLTDIATWAMTDGSMSFGTGLGRIFQRAAEHWEDQRDLNRAESAYLMARPLLPLSGVESEWTALLRLARLDARRSLHVRSLARRLHVLTELPPPASAEHSIAWMRDVDFTLPLIDIPTGMIGTGAIAMQAIEKAAERLGTLLGMDDVLDKAVSELPPDFETSVAELKQAWDDYNPAAEGAADSQREFSNFARNAIIFVAREQLVRAKPQIGLLRAMRAERLGWDAAADQWYQSALDQLEAAGSTNQWLGVLVLGAWGKHSQARELIERIIAEGTVDARLIPSLALRARDFERARELFAKHDAETATSAEMSWIDLLDRAEAALECGDAAAALGPVTRAIVAFEDEINRLLRDPHRIATCDDIKVAALYLLASRVHLALADRAAVGGDANERIEALRQAFAISDRAHALTLPRIASMSNPSSGDFRRWQQVATEQSTAYQRYVAALALGDDKPSANLVKELARSEQALADVEAQLPATERETLERCQRLQTFTLDDAQSRLPDGSCLLEYQLLGRDLLAWAITRSSVDGGDRRLTGRPLDGTVRRLLWACASGAASSEADLLAKILLDPFSSVLERCERVIVVPYGPLHTVPFHVLPFRGRPLGTTHVVSYLPAAALLAEETVDRPLRDRTALVVGDPAFRSESHPALKRLPGAELEARVVAPLYAGDGPFCAEDAREEFLRPLLHGPSVLHFAAHGRLDELAPNTSSIVLADDDELTVSDLIGLHFDADLVVLSACDTGRGAMTLGGDVIGLTRGLLAAGVRRCVVSLWPVDDVAACITMVRFHERLRSEPPAIALAKTQREIRAMSGEDLAARYQALGGTAESSRRSLRRKSGELGLSAPSMKRLAPFPEVDVAENGEGMVGDRDGSLASLWAPFVLIGS